MQGEPSCSSGPGPVISWLSVPVPGQVPGSVQDPGMIQGQVHSWAFHQGSKNPMPVSYSGTAGCRAWETPSKESSIPIRGLLPWGLNSSAGEPFGSLAGRLKTALGPAGEQGLPWALVWTICWLSLLALGQPQICHKLNLRHCTNQLFKKRKKTLLHYTQNILMAGLPF